MLSARRIAYILCNTKGEGTRRTHLSFTEAKLRNSYLRNQKSSLRWVPVEVINNYRTVKQETLT